MDALLEQLRSLAVQADSDDRQKVLDFIRTLQLSLETPRDMLSRFLGLVSSILSHLDQRTSLGGWLTSITTFEYNSSPYWPRSQYFPDFGRK
jgi:hypothetical protein